MDVIVKKIATKDYLKKIEQLKSRKTYSNFL